MATIRIEAEEIAKVQSYAIDINPGAEDFLQFLAQNVPLILHFSAMGTWTESLGTIIRSYTRHRCDIRGNKWKKKKKKATNGNL